MRQPAETVRIGRRVPPNACGPDCLVARLKGSGTAGPTRSLRLPRALDAWFLARLERKPEASPSEVLVQLIHGGLRLREGYMEIHRRALETALLGEQSEQYRFYRACLLDSFGPEYVAHLERWLEADGISVPTAPAHGSAEDAGFNLSTTNTK